LDGVGNPVAGATVTLAATGTGNTITQPVGTTGVDGRITGSLSSTKAEAKTVSATVNGAVALTQTATVTVTADVATRLAFTVQPSNTPVTQHITPAVQVAALDAFGNTATSFMGTVAIAIGTNGGVLPGTLHGTLSQAAVAGVATFGDLSIDQIGNGYTLVVSVTGLTGATSAPFNITL
jgi:hypothetical protein